MTNRLVRSPLYLAATICFLAAATTDAANIIVTSVEQKITSTGGCSLEEAIYAANFFESKAIRGYDLFGNPIFIPTQCTAGTGNDTIILPAQALFLMKRIVDDADNVAGPTATPIITSTITIIANGSTFQRLSADNFRLFTVGDHGSLAIQEAYIKGFQTKGGDGGRGGGGGLGAGGAIYVKVGTLTVESCTFDGNQAAGGNGSSLGATHTGGGGGGGLSGNGSPALGVTASGGGGGGGSRGNGSQGYLDIAGFGGDGGGTLATGGTAGGAGAQGLFCLGSGDNGHDGGPGGGGGGGESGFLFLTAACYAGGNGGLGGYGAGGGGGGGNYPLDLGGSGSGGKGGIVGGGGGAGGPNTFLGVGGSGGDGGFGGGGGASHGGFIAGGPGHGYAFLGGGNADENHGGGGSALGGAIFNDSGTVTIANSTFANNVAVRGLGGGGDADKGIDAGGAIFTRNGVLVVRSSTFSQNQGTGSGAGIVVVGDGALSSFTLNNTIIFGNGNEECFLRGTVVTLGINNLIDSNGGGHHNNLDFNPCPNPITGADPLLGPLQLNAPGDTPTMAIPSGSPAQNNADRSTSPILDQRGIARATDGGYDIGAFEFCPTCIRLKDIFIPTNLHIQVAPAGAGITDPTAGSHPERPGDLIALKATPKPGFSFSQWTGNVTDPLSASTTVTINTDQIATLDQFVTAQFVPGSTVLGGNILTKSGPQNARVWPVSVAEAGVVTAHSAQISTFTLTQVFGAACTPVLFTPLPAIVGDLNPGATASVNLTFDFTTCAAAARFTAVATFSANGGGVTGSMTRTNQFQ